MYIHNCIIDKLYEGVCVCCMYICIWHGLGYDIKAFCLPHVNLYLNPQPADTHTQTQFKAFLATYLYFVGSNAALIALGLAWLASFADELAILVCH